MYMYVCVLYVYVFMYIYVYLCIYISQICIYTSQRQSDAEVLLARIECSRRMLNADMLTYADVCCTYRFKSSKLRLRYCSRELDA
jgi:hypothetical protein